MTFRLPLLALAALVLVAGCDDSAEGGESAADASAIAEGDAFEQTAFNVGFQTAQQFLGQDSSFNYDRFVDGFRRGTAGDSVEIAYAIGLQYGLQFRQDTSNTLDRGLFLAGVQAALAGEESPLTPEQVRAAQSAVEDSVQLRQLRAAAPTNPQARARLDLIRANQTQADSFLTAARGTEGVQELGNGVLYRVDEPGDGASPQLGQRVTVRYRGTLPNGQVFDQTQEEPATFLVDNVVPGFQAALLDMQVGETRTVFIPPSQGYGLGGSQGPGGQGGIPPNAALQFEITLLDVADGPTPGAQFDPSQLGL